MNGANSGDFLTALSSLKNSYPNFPEKTETTNYGSMKITLSVSLHLINFYRLEF